MASFSRSDSGSALHPVANLDSPQSIGLALWLPSGSREDATDRNRIATAGSGASLIVDPMFGRVWDLDGTANGYLNWNPVAFDGAAFNNARGHSVSAWINPDVVNTNQTAINWTSGFLTLNQFRVTSAGNIIIGADVDFGGTTYGTVVTGASAGTWYHIAYTWQTVGGTSTHRCYLNGALVTTSTAAQHTGVIAQFDVGRRNDVSGVGSPFNGKVGDVRFYARALSDADVYAMWDPSTRWDVYRPMRVRFAPSLVVALQLARAISTVSAGTWTTDSGGTTNLHLSIDEDPASDADYIRSELTGASDTEVKLRLDPLTDPAASTGHTIRYRYAKSSASGDTVGLRVTLYAADGTTEITHQDHAAISGSVTAGSFTLSGAEADAIPSADYATGLVVGFVRI